MNCQILLTSVTTQSHQREPQRRKACPWASASAASSSSRKSSISIRRSRSRSRSRNSPVKSQSSKSSFPMKNVFLVLTIGTLLASIARDVRADGPNCMQNGMGPQNLYHNGEMNPEYMWSRVGSNIYVPVVMDETYTPRQLKRILSGFKEIEQKTCVSFHYFNNHTIGNLDHVYVTRQHQGCWSYIGRIGGRQEMSLPRGCQSHRTAVHEMIHALGFAHEHVRSDRDNYVVVNWENIQEGLERNFVKRKTKSSDPYGPYDYGSIMHYPREAFSINGLDTITPKKEDARIGLDHRMSYWDVKKVNRMYKCDGIFGGGGGGGGGGEYGYGHGFSPDENEINNFIEEGHGEGDVDPNLDDDDHPGHSHGRHGHGHGHSGHDVAHEPGLGSGIGLRDEIFGFESSHHSHSPGDLPGPQPEHSPVQPHRYPHEQEHEHQPRQQHFDAEDDDDYFRPTHGPFPSPNRSRQSRGPGSGPSHYPPRNGNGLYHNHEDEFGHSNNGNNGNDNGNGVQQSSFRSQFPHNLNADVEFQSHTEPQSALGPGPNSHGHHSGNGNGNGNDRGQGHSHSYSFREDHPLDSDSNSRAQSTQFSGASGSRQPTVFDAPPHFFEQCFPFC